jgi:hypothetical protein
VLEPWIIEQIRRREEEQRRRQEQPRLEIPARDERWKRERDEDAERDRDKDTDDDDREPTTERGVVIIEM